MRRATIIKLIVWGITFLYTSITAHFFSFSSGDAALDSCQYGMILIIFNLISLCTDLEYKTQDKKFKFFLRINRFLIGVSVIMGVSLILKSRGFLVVQMVNNSWYIIISEGNLDFLNIANGFSVKLFCFSYLGLSALIPFLYFVKSLLEDKTKPSSNQNSVTREEESALVRI